MISPQFIHQPKTKLIGSALLLIAALIVVSVSLSMQNTAEATGVTGWDAGRIIDDSVFTNVNTMSVQQIQDFLVSKVPVCDTWGTNGTTSTSRSNYFASMGYPLPIKCLTDYTENGKSAAQIIYDAAQQYQINPQVLIVLLQKEQGLVTDDWPDPTQYKSATGYGCPDTSVCDSQYYGFTNQIINSAKMFRAIINNSPTWYTPYVIGNNYIQYNPSASCGGSVVYIQNRATQALYNYTPYQPNSATLAAGWNTATCGAYGNRNFYLYFTKWFGAATSAATYGYSFVSTELYYDYEYKNKIPDGTAIEPGQKFYAQITIKNTGNQNWYSDNLHLGTSGDGVSQFQSNGWLGGNRPAAMVESTVGQGENATFQFEMQAPTDLGTYNEQFGVLIEGYRWIGGCFSVPITVGSSDPYYSTEVVSFKAYSDSGMTSELSTSNITKYTDSKVYIKAIIKNTGNQTLSGSLTHIATSDPIDRVSLFNDSSWITNSRAAAAQEGDILPQKTGIFTFSITTPSTELARTKEQFGLVIEGQQWLSDNVGSLSIQTNQRPSSSIFANVGVGVNEWLLSNNEQYMLILQGDGNLVLYNKSWKALWASNTVGTGGIRLIMQGDGNLVIYDKNWKPTWNSGTAGK